MLMFLLAYPMGLLFRNSLLRDIPGWNIIENKLLQALTDMNFIGIMITGIAWLTGFILIVSGLTLFCKKLCE